MIVLPPPVPSVLGALAGEVAAAGGRAWLVGGAVRDALLGRAPLDLDVEREAFAQNASRMRFVTVSTTFTRAEYLSFASTTVQGA